jgi:hypothetical protein
MPSTMIFVSWMTDWLNARTFYDLMLDAAAVDGPRLWKRTTSALHR